MNNTERTIVLTRELKASPERIWLALTTPEALNLWWGPKGFTNTTHRIEVKAGGVWEFTMHGPDGTDYPNKIVYKDLIEPQAITFHHGNGEVTDPDSFDVTMSLESKGEVTVLTMTSLFMTAEARDNAVNTYGAVEGGNQTLEKLEQYLMQS